MKRYISICGLAAVSMLLPACATVTRGTSQKYVIESEPPQADVALSTGQKCVTPCKLKLKRKHGFTASFSKPGYAPQQAQVKSKFSGGGAAAGAGNILAGGVIGAVVDGTNGSLNNLTPNPLRVTLVPLAEGEAATTAMDAPAPTGSSETAQADPQL
jgi:hypothetical protein